MYGNSKIHVNIIVNNNNSNRIDKIIKKSINQTHKIRAAKSVKS